MVLLGFASIVLLISGFAYEVFGSRLLAAWRCNNSFPPMLVDCRYLSDLSLASQKTLTKYYLYHCFKPPYSVFKIQNLLNCRAYIPLLLFFYLKLNLPKCS